MDTENFPIYPPPSYDAIVKRRNSTKSMHTLERASLYSDSASETMTIASYSKDSQTTFLPGRRLQIDARGVGLFRMPIPIPITDSQMEIPIRDRLDGDRLVYISKRSKLHSGDAILSNAQTDEEFVATKYFFGPGRDPILQVGFRNAISHQKCTSWRDSRYEIPLHSKWTSRTMTFTIPAFRSGPECQYQWAYGKRRDPETGKRINLIVLRRQPTNDSGHKGNVIAEFVRSVATRTAGSSRATAGNGGLLVIDQEAHRYLDEEIVVATCLVMLKREIDRRRLCQIAVIM